MNHLWPVFHDPAYQPSRRERYSFHWAANLRMLRSPRDIALFMAISLLPLLVLVGFQELFPGLYVVTAGPTNPAPNMAPLIFAGLVTFLVYMVLQHLAFVLAINLTYVHHVHAVLRDRGIPVCPACSNLLDPGTPGAACPECGDTGSSATMRDSDRTASIDDPAAHDSEDPSR